MTAASADVVVLGGGPAGLAAAWRAALRGRSVVLLEREDRPGGMAGSFEVAGVRVDHGSHRLHPSTPPPVLAELRRLLGDDLQVRPRNGRIRLAGRWIAFPLRTGDLVRRLPPAFAAGSLRDAVLSPLRRPRADTFAEVVRAGLGPTVADAFYLPYARKLWGADPSELAGELARRRVSAGSPLAVARRLVRGARPEGRTFLYPRTGFGAISERVCEAAVDAGADVRLGTAVESLEPCGDRWRVRLPCGGAVDAPIVWSTLPVAVLPRLVPGAPPAVAGAAGRLEHRAMALVYVVLDRPRYTPFDAHYFPGLDTPVSRLSEPRNYRDGDDPPGRTVLCAEVPCSVGDGVWAASDADLGASVAASLEAQGLPPVAPVAVEVRRLPRVYPVMRPGTSWDLSAVELWAGTLPGLVTFGRQGLFVPDNTHHALAMGWAAADALRDDGTFDTTRWTAARESFRANVVED